MAFFFVFLMLYTTVRVPDISITPTRTAVSGSSHSLLPHTLAIYNLSFLSGRFSLIMPPNIFFFGVVPISSLPLDKQANM